MNKLYFKLAVTNMKNNRRFYLPYLLTGMLSVAMFYLMASMQDNPGLMEMEGGVTVKMVLSLGLVVVGLFTGIFLFYTNSFITKRRKKELGIYNILGMEKKHIAKMLFMETLFTLLLALGGGLLFGISFNKFLTMFLYRLTGFDAAIPFYISKAGCVHTLILFAVIYGLSMGYNLLQMRLANPIELLHGSSVGEREPKTKILLTIIGIAALGSGYYIALTIADAAAAIMLFFVAVLLVIVGTYALFTAGSIAFLKLLRKNKKYYYQSRHFTMVSGMIYRMKQNAVGLANICILSTMVLVTVSTTLCMYVGAEATISAMYPADIQTFANFQELPEDYRAVDRKAEETLENAGIEITGHTGFLSFNMSVIETEDGYQGVGIGAGTQYDSSDVTILTVMPRAEYVNYVGENLPELKENEAVLTRDKAFEKEMIVVEGMPFAVKETREMPEGINPENLIALMGGEGVLVVADETAFSKLYEIVLANWTAERGQPRITYESRFDLAASSEEKIAAGELVFDALAKWEGSGAFSTSTKEEALVAFYTLYGGLLFLGMFLGILFLMVTVLIIFYKQISEGYEDKERFAIMEKVGMSNLEVKRTIRSQVLTVFFLPVAAAVVHVAMAFPMIKLILDGFGLTNTMLFVGCVAGTSVVFFVIYLMVFLLTSRSYYKIVGNQV